MIELDPRPAHGRYTLRHVVENDFDFLWQLKVATLKPYIEKLYGWNETQAKDILRKVMHGAHLVLVNAQPAGILKIEVLDGFVYLAEIGLMPEHQNQGLGTQIIQDVIALADGLGLPLELQVFAINPAVKLYERLGFGVTHYKMYRPAVANSPGPLG
jgi:GNAT superfamily N-acetyltransferase